MGAHQALLQFENVRVLKEMRNQVNRLVNVNRECDKTIKAAMSQVEDIRLIEEHMGLMNSRPSRQVAKLRLENPYVPERVGHVRPSYEQIRVNYRSASSGEGRGNRAPLQIDLTSLWQETPPRKE